DDPAVRLVRYEPVNIRWPEAICMESLIYHLSKPADRVAEDLAPLHAEKPGRARGRWPAIDIEQFVTATVGMKVGREHAAIRDAAGRWCGLQHDGACAIAEQHAGATVLPVQNA